jgi:hypothetical protein
MPTLGQVRTAARDTITAAIPSLFGYRTVPDVVNGPAVIVSPSDVDFNVTMGRGFDTYTFDVTVLVALTDAALAQDTLDGYVTGSGSLSIRQAVFNNRSLGITGTDAHIRSMRSYGATYDIGEISYVGAVLELVVQTTGTA